MFSTGSKFFLGLAAAATAGAVLYGATQNFGALGAFGLLFSLFVLSGLLAAVIWSHDGDVSAMDATAVHYAPAGAVPAGSSMWPMVAAVAATLLVVGVVTDKRYFVAGVGILLVAIVEWMVRAWADRASGDAGFNRRVRSRLLHPLELPLAGLAGLSVIIYGFSRVMLAADKKAGPAIFGVGAALVLAFGTLFSAKPQLRRSLVAGVCAFGGVAVLAGGIASAAHGQRAEITDAQVNDHFSSRDNPRPCEAFDQEADADASGAVAAKSNTIATFVFDGTNLTIDQIANSLDGQPLTVDRGNTVSVLFRNKAEGEYRLRIYGGMKPELDAAGNPVKDPSDPTKTITRPREFCTRAIKQGKTQILTFSLPKPSVLGTDPFYAEVPGVDGAKVGVVVP